MFLEHISKAASSSLRTIRPIAWLVKVILGLQKSSHHKYFIYIYIYVYIYVYIYDITIGPDIIAFAIEEGEWSAPRLRRFYLGECFPNTFWIGRWVGPRLVTCQ